MMYGGIPKPVLLLAAGILQTGKDFTTGEYSKAVKELQSLTGSFPPYGDEFDDFIFDLLGMDYADQGKASN